MSALLECLNTCMLSDTLAQPLLVQVEQLRQSPDSPLVKSRTLLRKVGEHQRAKAKFQAFLDEATDAKDFESR